MDNKANVVEKKPQIKEQTQTQQELGKDFQASNPFIDPTQPNGDNPFVATTQLKKANPFVNAIQKKAENPFLGTAKLKADVKGQMEGYFQTDFSDVNIHTNSNQAAQMKAQAFTQGNEVHFAQGKFDTQSLAGKELIGHELAHVVQQRNGEVKPTTQMKGVAVNDDQHLEKQADKLGAEAAKAPSQASPIQQKTASNQTNSDAVVQGKFDHTKKSLEAEGLKAGFSRSLGKSTFQQLLDALSAYEKAGGNPTKQTNALQAVIAASNGWLGSKSRKKATNGKKMVNDIFKEEKINKIIQDAKNELQIIKEDEEDRQYVEDSNNKFVSTDAKKNGNSNRTGWAKSTLAEKSDTYDDGDPEWMKKTIDGRNARVNLVQSSKLREGELSALNMFTGDDYKYMKPAYEGSDSWLEESLLEMGRLHKQVEGVQGPATKNGAKPNKIEMEGEERKALIEAYKNEGKKHTEMAIRALAKLPNHTGKVYRGMGITPADFEKNYKVGKNIRYNNIISTSTEEGTAKGFMASNAAKGVMILIEIDCKSGKDVKMLSQVSTENEIIYAPITFSIKNVEKEGSYYRIQMSEK